MGDMNLNLNQPTSAGVQRYVNILEELDLTQMITSPTRTTATSATLIDHAIVSRPELVSSPRVIKCSISDHDAIAIDVQQKRTRRRAPTITVRSTRRTDTNALCLDHLQADWSLVYGAETPQQKWNAWLETWQPHIDRHMPLKTVRVKHPPSPWLQDNSELKERMEERDRAREARDCDKEDTAKQQAYRDCRNAVKRAQNAACSAYYAQSYQRHKSKTWTDIRRFLIAARKPEPRTVPAYQSDPAWADRLNRHFVEAGAEVAAALSAAPQGAALPPRPPRVCAGGFRVRSVTLPELSIALRSMGNSNACAGDGITIAMLKLTFAVVGPHLCHVINSSPAYRCSATGMEGGFSYPTI